MDAVAHIAADSLVPACGGAEKPFTVSGRQWLYCYHSASGRHCYLDLDNDHPVWHRGFHPAFHPEFEFAAEAELPQSVKQKPDYEELEDFYF
ncbi:MULTISPECIES: hypothetical protein [unclassified Shewanella]|uniref:hypothetical protein n=1 Tax=unclassified Shewanella TaxID=196818 RepID=UPI001F06150A|nr:MULTISPECIES: hypothetical protein [unclassified Shewanella]